MGGFTSKASQMMAEQQQQIAEDNKKRAEEEKKKREAIEKKLAEDLGKEEERIRSEIEEERQKKLEETRKRVNDSNQMKTERQDELKELEKELKETNEQIIQETKKNGLEQVTQEMKNLNKDREKLIQNKDDIMRQNERLAEKQKVMKAEISELKKQKEKEEMDKSQKHHEELEKLNQEKNNIVKEGEKTMVNLTEEQRGFQKKIHEHIMELNGVRVANAVELQSILNDDQTFEDFRRKSRGLINQFNAFKSEFDQEESAINTTRDDIEDGIELSFRSDLSDVLFNLRELGENVEGFDLSGSNDEEKYSQIRKNVKYIINKLITTLNEMQNRILRYETNHPKTYRQNYSSATSMCSDLEIDSAVDSLTSSVTHLKSTKSHDFSIVNLNKEAKGLISELSDEMLNFNIRASTAFDDALAIQFQNLSTSYSQTVSQIANGSSTSSANRITYGREPGNQPSIQQVDEPDEAESSTESTENEK